MPAPAVRQHPWPQAAGIGLSYLDARPELVAALLPDVDYVEMSPEIFAADVGHGELRFDRDAAQRALDVVGDLPIALHGLELSIGSAHGWNPSSLRLLNDFLAMRPMLWHSEHLNFLTALDAGGAHIDIGLPMPLPFTAECAALVAERADAVIRRYGATFLLENSTYYLPDLPADDGWDEATFLTALTDRSGCGLLLDLFNLWTNCVNHNLDADDLLARIPIDRVIEVHVAGGDERDGLLLDSHSAAVPDAVWTMLQAVLATAPNLAGVTVEVLDLYAHRLGVDGIRDQLRIARDLWRQR